jgi:LacI family transcriptional regulator
VRHLHAAGLRRFAYCSFLAANSEDRGPSFARKLKEKGFGCELYSDFTRLPADAPWQERQKDVARWVRKLAKPVGILTWNPDVACLVIEACNRTSTSVPGEVAVLTADDDPMKCELSSPTISAIEIPAVRIGYDAAALLDKLMDGSAAPKEEQLIEPSGMVTMRESTRTADLPDRDVHLAVQYIREHATSPIGIGDVARDLAVSRRWLERHFQRVLGHSPREELRQSRLELAKRMLLDTDLDAGKVAAASGFSSPSYFNAFFRRLTGMTPLDFRSQYRLTPSRRERR